MANIFDPASIMDFGGFSSTRNTPLLEVQPFPGSPLVSQSVVVPTIASTGPVMPAKSALSEAEQLKADLAQIDWANADPDAMAALTLSEDRGNSLTAGNKVLDDYDGLTPLEFQDKYGWDIYKKLVSTTLGGHEIRRLAGTDRDMAEILNDVGVDAIGGLNQGAIALGDSVLRNTLAPGPTKDALLGGIAGLAEAQAESTHLLESLGLDKLQYVNSIRAFLDSQDNQAAFEADQADDQNLVDWLASRGANVLREGYSGGKRLIEDPNMLGVLSSEGVGSLLLGGPTSKVLSTATKGLAAINTPRVAGVATRTLDAAIDQVKFPITIGAMESGGAAIQAEQQVLNMPEVELQASLEYQALLQSGLTPETARLRLASEAGNIAAPLPFLVGAATGKLVERIELAPFKRSNPVGLTVNAAKETVEEGIQSGTGQLASNAGVLLSGADPDQDLSMGVGDAIVQGAAAGAGTTVLTQGPLTALALSAKAVGFTVKTPTKLLVDVILNRYENIASRDAAGSTISPENMAPAVQTAVDSAPAVAETLQTLAADQGAKGEEVEAYIQSVVAASQIQESDLEMMPEAVSAYLQSAAAEGGKIPNRFETLNTFAQLANDEGQPREDRVAAATYILKNIEANKQLFEELPSFMEKVPHAREEAKIFANYVGILTAIEQTPTIQEALAWARESMKMPDQDLSEVDLSTPEGTKIVAQAVAVATVAPQAMSIQIADQILYQADSGKATLTPEQRRILKGARALKDAEQVYAAQAEAPADAIDLVSKQIEKDGGAKAHQLSLIQHVAGINQAIEKGDTKAARARVNSLGMFARHMRNKLEAMNTAIKNGDRKNVSYQSLGRDGWLKKDEYFSVYYNPGTKSSERLARQIHAEATAVATLANSFAEGYALNEVKIPALETLPPTKAQSAEETNEKRGSSDTEEPAPSQATTSRTDDNSAKPELPLQKPAPTQEQGQAQKVEQPVKAQEIVPETTKTRAKETAETAPEVIPEIASVETKDTVDADADAINSLSAAEVVQLIEEFDDSTPITQLKTSEAFPTLVQPNGKNWFHSAFRLARTRSSRMLGVLAPLNAFVEALQSGRGLRSFMDGREVKYQVSGEDAAAVLELLTIGDTVLKTMKQRLRDVLTAKKNGKPSLLEMLNAGEEINRWRDLRVLNIMEKTDKGYRYNQSLIETAILAGLDWVMNATDRVVPLDRDDVAAILGVGPDEVKQKHIDDFKQGISLDTAKRDLAKNIRKFWGVEANKDELDDYVKGIPEAVAAEILHGLESAGLLELGIRDKALNYPELGTNKVYNRVWFDSVRTNKKGKDTAIGKLMKSLSPISNLLADMALIEREAEGYQIGEPIQSVDKTQLRNSMVPTTPMQRQALENAQATSYRPNNMVFDFFKAMGVEAFVTLMSGKPYKTGDLDKSYTEIGLNKNDWESLKGLQRQLASSFENVSRQMAAVENYPADQRVVYYKHHVNKLGRIQMDGLSNPQTDKFAREIFMPTQSTIDLSDPGSEMFQRFLMAIGQGIGLNTQRETRAVVAQKVIASAMTEGGTLYPLVQALKAGFSSEALKLLKVAGLTMHGVHSLLAVAKYELARDGGQDLETFTYLEADGKTSGPINSLLLYGTGEITSTWLKTVAKGGAFLGRLGKTLNAHMSEDNKDLYEEGADDTAIRVKALGQEIEKDNPEAHQLFQSFQRLLAELDVNVNFNSATGELTIKRGIIKNPLTITIYGSGATGIAGKITDELLTSLYEILSTAGTRAMSDSLSDEFADDLSALTSKVALKNDMEEWYATGKPIAISGSAQDFTLSSKQYKNLRSNIKAFLVNPMRSAIEDMVTTHVSSVTSVTQQSTQIQSIILKAMFLDKIATRLAMKQANPEEFGYTKGEFLSQQEQDDIRQSLLPFSPIISTGTQSYFLSGGETSDLFETQAITIGDQQISVSFPESFSRSLTGDMSIPATVYGPTLAGVKVIPTLVIGSGEGQMQINFLATNKNGSANRVLPVFDGLNMPVDAIDDYSQLINQSVFSTWTSEANPVRAAFESFKAFLAKKPIEALFGDGSAPRTVQQEQALEELSQVALGRFNVGPDDYITLSTVPEILEDILQSMSWLADETDARRLTYKEFPFSVDQMASAESPFVNQGTIALSPDASYDDIADAMNERYKYHLAQIELKHVRESLEVLQQNKATEALATVGKVDELGARVVQADELPALFKAISNQLTPTQREMMRQATKLLAGSGYRMVFGSGSVLDAWEQANEPERYTPNTERGKIDPVTKTILIRNTYPETIVHELIHAATIDKVRAFYQDPSLLSQEERDAVTRIEGLMGEWLRLDPNRENRVEAYDARRLAEDAIHSRLQKGQKTEALNEFMAWVLGNQHLAETAQKIKIKNPLWRIVGDVLATLKSLLWGDPKKGARVGDSLLSNLRFNTRVLMNGPTQLELLQQDSSAVVMYQSKSFGESDRLVEIRRRLNNKVTGWLKGDGGPIAKMGQVLRQAEMDASRRLAEQVTTTFAYHFQDLGTMQAQSTFTSVQLALMTEIELNSNALSRMEDLYAHVIEGLKYTAFRKNDDPSDVNDDYQARQKYDALLGRFIQVTDKHGRSSLLSSFLALAMTSDLFRDVLKGIEKPKADKSEATGLDAVLENAGNAVMNSLSVRMSGEGSKATNVRYALDNLMYAMIENVGDQRTFIGQRTENGFDKINNYLANLVQDKSAIIAEKSAEIVRNSNSRIVKAGAGLVSFVATMINEQKATVAALGMVSWLNKRNGLNPFKEVIADVVGRTSENAPIFDMISKVRATVQQVRQQFRDELPVKLNRMFKKPVSKANWTAMFKALGKTDLASLTGSFGVAGALELLTDANRLANEIEGLERSIKAQDEVHIDFIKAKAEQLAHYMVSGEHGTKLLRNATAIGNLLGIRSTAHKAAPQLIEEIDRLVTLYAIAETDQAAKDAVTNLLQNGEREGVEFVTSYLIGQRADELAKLDGNDTALYNHYKGHIPSEVLNGGSLIIASDTEHAHLLSRGYTRIDAYTGSSADRLLGKRSYYFAPVSGRAPFTQGVLQTVHQTASGIDPESGFTVGTIMAGRIEDYPSVQRIERLITNQRQTDENLLPVYDDRGRLYAFERGADPKRLMNLDHSTDLAEMIGVWRGRQAEELLAQEVNQQLVDRLHEIWIQGEKDGRQDEFVNIAKLNPKTDDRILIEAVGLIPNQAKKAIAAAFGPGRFMVRRDMLLDTFGARQASVGDLFSGKTRWNPKVASQFEKIATGIFGGRKILKEKTAYELLVGVEANLQELVGNVKTNIVVKSILVPTANIVSNMLQLLNRGVPIRSIIHGFQAKTAEINTYIKRRAQEIDLEADLRAAMSKKDDATVGRITNQLQSIRDSYKRMSIWPLIEAGEFSAISDGQVTGEDLAIADGKWLGFIEDKVNRLKEPLRTPARYALITRDTALFKGLARAVQYGDFVAKAVLYEDLTKRKKVKTKDAIATVNEAFINYNRLAGRSRQYLESVGLLWFYNYKLRIMKEAVYLLRHNPLRSLLMLSAPRLPVLGDIGTPLVDNFVALFNDGKLGYSVGPGMGLSSWQLNPWINLMR